MCKTYALKRAVDSGWECRGDEYQEIEAKPLAPPQLLLCCDEGQIAVGHFRKVQMPTRMVGTVTLFVRVKLLQLAFPCITSCEVEPIEAVLGFDIANSVLHIDLCEKPISLLGEIADDEHPERRRQFLSSVFIAEEVIQNRKSDVPFTNDVLRRLDNNLKTFDGVNVRAMAPHFSARQACVHHRFGRNEFRLWVTILDEKFEKPCGNFSVLGGNFEDLLRDGFNGSIRYAAISYSVAQPTSDLEVSTTLPNTELEKVGVDPRIVSDVDFGAFFDRYQRVTAHRLSRALHIWPRSDLYRMFLSQVVNLAPFVFKVGTLVPCDSSTKCRRSQQLGPVILTANFSSE